MRFSANGPDIPDQLLWARDEGNVVFVCGAGVSTRAGLPNFYELVSEVMRHLRVSERSNARRIYEIAKKDEVRGLVSFDRIFGELEREYTVPDIERAVELSLSRQETVDTIHHDIICELAYTSNAGLRLITTNFDDIFSLSIKKRLENTKKPSSDSSERYKEWICSNLPNVSEKRSFTGLVHLHGKAGHDEIPYGSRFVLSTRSFGEAYLADGWASRFLKEILKRFTVVFVGYSAEDPPLQYLLEALAQTDSSMQDAYAFQHGTKDNADEKWRRKGVTPICYDEHDDLWETLELWSNRARNFSQWANAILDSAQSGPFNQSRWQRSQVKHLADHPWGAELIAKAKRPISPRWLFAFDHNFRYAEPYSALDQVNKNINIDPFDLLSFEEDVAPPYSSSSTSRDVPKSAWHFLKASPFDKIRVNELSEAGTSGVGNAENVYGSSERINFLLQWIANVSDDPITVRWAVHQPRLDNTLCHNILEKLDRGISKKSKIMYTAWEELFECWRNISCNYENDLNNLERIVKKYGWTKNRVSQYQWILQPRLKPICDDLAAELNSCKGSLESTADIIAFDVMYCDDSFDLECNEDWIIELMNADRKNLDIAIDLEDETGIAGYKILPNLTDSGESDPFSYSKRIGINKIALQYLNRFDALLEIDHHRALIELDSWRKQESYIYERFLLWVIYKGSVLTSADTARTILNMSQQTFWDLAHRYDFIHTLVSCWSNISKHAQARILKRMSKGPDRIEIESDSEYSERRAWTILNMIEFLKINGCSIKVDTSKMIQKLKSDCLEWNPKDAIGFDKPVWLRVGTQETVKDHKVLYDVPIDEVIDTAKYYMDNNEHPFQEIDMFGGLCSENPGMAIAALRSKAKIDEYPEWAWCSLLRTNWDVDISKKYLHRTTGMLCKATDQQFEEMKYFIFSWFSNVSKKYRPKSFGFRDFLFRRLVGVIRISPNIDFYTVDEREIGSIGWVSKSLNSKTGRLVAALQGFSEYSRRKKGALQRGWLDLAASLLSLDGNSGRFALVSFMRDLRYLHYRAPQWTKDHILRVATEEDALTHDAYWEGFAASGPTGPDLYIDVKEKIIEKLLSNATHNNGVAKSLSAIVFGAWVGEMNNDGSLITDDEFSDILVNGSEQIGADFLEHFWYWATDERTAKNLERAEKIERFLMNIWPLNEAFISESTNLYLLKIIFLSEGVFSKFYPIAVNRFGEIERFDIFFKELDDEYKTIMKKYPVHFLDVLHRTFPRKLGPFLRDIGKFVDILIEAGEVSDRIYSDDRYWELWARVNGL